MTRTKGILAAGTLTGLVLMTILALGWRSAGAGAADAPLTAAPQTVQTGADAAALQSYATELETAVQTLQARETQYRQQIEAANQTIQQLQASQAQPARGFNGADWEAHEHEAHEGGLFGFGERDDD